MLKKIVVMSALVAACFTFAPTPEANAWVVRRVAPVRRAARVVLPPYRRVYRPVVRRPVVVGAPVVYGPRVHVGVGYGGYYGW